jgi:8-oxo-dGTP pyrophosphatase MutT (NUDIX family)
VSGPRPVPGEELNPGPESVPRPASTVILLRGGERTLEVLLVKRNPAARFMGGAWVFPGGAVGPEDGSGQIAHRRAALRELEEEAGIALEGPEQLLPFARWITPPQVKTRFDTWFYLAAAPEQARASIDAAEVVDFGWFTPAAALERHVRGDLLLVFPTIKQLEALTPFASAAAALAQIRGREVVPVQPVVLGSGETARIVLPGEPGFRP